MHSFRGISQRHSSSRRPQRKSGSGRSPGLPTPRHGISPGWNRKIVPRFTSFSLHLGLHGFPLPAPSSPLCLRRPSAGREINTCLPRWKFHQSWAKVSTKSDPVFMGSALLPLCPLQLFIRSLVGIRTSADEYKGYIAVAFDGMSSKSKQSQKMSKVFFPGSPATEQTEQFQFPYSVDYSN